MRKRAWKYLYTQSLFRHVRQSLHSIHDSHQMGGLFALYTGRFSWTIATGRIRLKSKDVILASALSFIVLLSSAHLYADGNPKEPNLCEEVLRVIGHKAILSSRQTAFNARYVNRVSRAIIENRQLYLEGDWFTVERQRSKKTSSSDSSSATSRQATPPKINGLKKHFENIILEVELASSEMFPRPTKLEKVAALSELLGIEMTAAKALLSYYRLGDDWSHPELKKVLHQVEREGPFPEPSVLKPHERIEDTWSSKILQDSVHFAAFKKWQESSQSAAPLSPHDSLYLKDIEHAMHLIEHNYKSQNPKSQEEIEAFILNHKHHFWSLFGAHNEKAHFETLPGTLSGTSLKVGGLKHADALKVQFNGNPKRMVIEGFLESKSSVLGLEKAVIQHMGFIERILLNPHRIELFHSIIPESEVYFSIKTQKGEKREISLKELRAQYGPQLHEAIAEGPEAFNAVFDEIFGKDFYQIYVPSDTTIPEVFSGENIKPVGSPRQTRVDEVAASLAGRLQNSDFEGPLKQFLFSSNEYLGSGAWKPTPAFSFSSGQTKPKNDSNLPDISELPSIPGVYFSPREFMGPEGAFLALENLKTVLGVGNFGKKDGVKHSILALAEKLPKSQEKERLLEHLENMPWSPADGNLAKQGRPTPQNRIYEGLYKVAQAINGLYPQNKMDLDTLHTRDTINALAQRLGVVKISSLTDKQINVFMSEVGAFTALENLKITLGVENFGAKDGAKKSILALAQRLPKSQEKARLLEHLEKISWSPTDGNTAKQGKPTSQNRIYGGLYRVAEAFNELYPQNKIDLETLLTREAINALAQRLGVVKFSSLTDKQTEVIMSEDGAFTELENLRSTLGVGSFSTNDGAKHSILALAEKLPKSQEKERLLEHLENMPWSPTDGSQAKQGYPTSQNRIYEGLYRVAEAFNELYPQNKVDLDTLHTREAINALAQKLGFFTPQSAEVFMSEDGAFPALENLKNTLGVENFGEKYGARKSIFALAQKLPKSQEKEWLLVHLENMPWSPADGSSAKQGYPTSQNRIYEGLYRVTEALNELYPQNKIDLETLLTREAINALAQKLGFFTPQRAEVFMSEDGALTALENLKNTLGVENFVKKYGAKKSIFALAQRLPKSQVKEKLLEHLENMPWSPQDGSHAKQGLLTSQNRIYEGLYRVAEAFNELYPQNKMDLDTLHTRDTINALAQKLGFFTPQRAEIFMSEVGAFTALENLRITLGVGNFSVKDGAKHSILALAQRLPKSKEKEKLFEHLENMPWSPADGSSAKQGYPTSQNRIYEGLYRVAKAFNELYPQNKIDLETLLTREAINALAQKLGFFTPQRAEVFMSEDGAFTALENLKTTLVVGSFSVKDGAKHSILALAQRLPKSQVKEKLLEHLDSMPWSPVDGANAKRGKPTSQNRIYEGLYQVAEAFNELYPQNKVDLDTLHTREGMMDLASRLGVQ